MKYIEINIKVPIYGNNVAIRDTYIKQAIMEGKWLKITTPNGSGYHNPREWVKTGKKIEKVFKIPNHPMVLYQNDARFDNKEPEFKEETLEDVNKGNAMLAEAFRKAGIVKTKQS